MKDRQGNFYIQMDGDTRDCFPDHLAVQFRLGKYFYYLEPRIYIPTDEEGDLVKNSVVMVKYTTAHYMAEFSEELHGCSD